MKRLLLCFFLVTILGSPAGATSSPPPPGTPKAGLSASSSGRLDWQMSKVIFSSWGGKEYDNAYPPVRWPGAMRTRGTELTISIRTNEVPEYVGIRMWKELRPNGIPKGERRQLHCYIDESPDGCVIRPQVTDGEVAWTVTFPPPWRGHVYVATAADWPDAQVAWINHLRSR